MQKASEEELLRSTKWAFWNMRARCGHESYPGYKYYGGRGIKVCPEWQGPGAEARFIATMGLKPSLNHSLDRVDGNGDYTPENCRWANKITQNNNRPSWNVMMNVGGKWYTCAEASRTFNIKYSALLKRKHSGWDDELAVTVPVRPWKNKACDQVSDIADMAADMVPACSQFDLSMFDGKQLLIQNAYFMPPSMIAGGAV